jgi:hypothetical protein
VDVATRCYAADTQLVDVATRCYAADTQLVDVATRCYVADTQLVDVATRCYVADTQLVDVATRCYAADTQLVDVAICNVISFSLQFESHPHLDCGPDKRASSRINGPSAGLQGRKEIFALLIYPEKIIIIIIIFMITIH